MRHGPTLPHERRTPWTWQPRVFKRGLLVAALNGAFFHQSPPPPRSRRRRRRRRHHEYFFHCRLGRPGSVPGCAGTPGQCSRPTDAPAAGPLPARHPVRLLPHCAQHRWRGRGHWQADATNERRRMYCQLPGSLPSACSLGQGAPQHQPPVWRFRFLSTRTSLRRGPAEVRCQWQHRQAPGRQARAAQTWHHDRPMPVTRHPRPGRPQ
jgi:hypothetical protein